MKGGRGEKVMINGDFNARRMGGGGQEQRKQ